MPSLSQAEVRTKVVDLINDAVHYALGLKESLETERQALESQDLNDVDAAVEGKAACVLKLQSFDDKRLQLCKSAGFAKGPEQMQELIEWCDESDLVSHRWEHLMSVAAEGSAMNMTNGAIIRVRQQQFESSLSVLRGVTPGSDTYGRHGGESGDLGSRSLAEA